MSTIERKDFNEGYAKYPVMWFKGLAVGPHIFQQNTLYHSSQLRKFFQCILPVFWGITNIEYEDELSNGIFKLRKIIGFGKNYTYFEINEEDNLYVELDQYKEELKEKALYIFLSVANNEYTEQKNITSSKYKPISKEISDLNNKEDKSEITLLKPKYFIEIGTTSNLQNSSIPLYKIIYNGMTYQITDYCFPTCYINNLSRLTNEIRSLVSLMKDKITFLKNNSNSSENNLLLSCVSNCLFPLERCLKSNVHPYELYTVLIDAVSNVFKFAESNKIPQIPEYKHEDIYESIKELITYVKENIQNISVSCIKYKFDQDSFRNSTIFTISPNIDMKDSLLIIGIEKNKAAEYQQTQEWIEQAIIASVDNIALTQEQRTIGARRFLITNFEELNIPRLENMITFGIKLDTTIITKNENICIFNLNTNLLPPSAIYMIQTNL